MNFAYKIILAGIAQLQLAACSSAFKANADLKRQTTEKAGREEIPSVETPNNDKNGSQKINDIPTTGDDPKESPKPPVTKAAPALVDEGSHSFPANDEITPLVFINQGAPVKKCTVNPDLPAGVSIEVSQSTCLLVGRPTSVQAAQTYVVTATSSDGSKDTAVISIEISSPTPLDCGDLIGGRWILVPADSDVGQTEDFCVMKYEAKLHNGTSIVEDGNRDASLDYTNPGDAKAVSMPEGRPWVVIPRTDDSLALDAERACSNLGQGYTLITNSMWQALARNIEQAMDENETFINWSGHPSLANTFINYGHSDGPAESKAASTDDDPCFGTNNEACATNTHADFSQKRTHTLSNGEIIWDLAGNVWEWVKNTSYFSYGPDSYIYTWTSDTGDVCAEDCMGPNGNAKAVFGPSGDYLHKTSSPYGGFGYGYISGDAGAILRGAFWFDLHRSGIYSMSLSSEPSMTYGSAGFRCAFARGEM